MNKEELEKVIMSNVACAVDTGFFINGSNGCWNYIT